MPPLRTCGGGRFTNTGGIESHCQKRGVRGEDKDRIEKWLICASVMTSIYSGPQPVAQVRLVSVSTFSNLPNQAEADGDNNLSIYSCHE